MQKKMMISMFVLMLLFSVNITLADTPVIVKISPIVERSIEYFNFSESIIDGYQLFSASIYNIGSIGCETRLRFDIYNSSDDEIVKSVWTETSNLEAGGYDDFEAYWYPYNISGIFYTKMRLYQCNEIYDGPVGEFSVQNKLAIPKPEILDKSALEIISMTNSEKSITLEVKSEIDMESVVFSPARYDPGWIVEDGKIEEIKKGEIEHITIKYDPSIWREEKVEFNIFDKENNYFSKWSYNIKKENNIDIKDIIISVMGIIIFVLLFLVLRENKKKKKKLKKKK